MCLTAELSPCNEPEVPRGRSWMLRTLVIAGCKDGIWVHPYGTNLTAAVAVANKFIALLSQPEFKKEVSYGWHLLDCDNIGGYQSYYQARYFVAYWGYVALNVDQAMYPSNKTVTEIGSDTALLICFPDRPLLHNTGFRVWSSTARTCSPYLMN